MMHDLNEKLVYLSKCHIYLQQKYILKFATDGAILTKTKNAVQGCMKLIPCDGHWRVLVDHPAYEKLDKEMTLYYFIGK